MHVNETKKKFCTACILKTISSFKDTKLHLLHLIRNQLTCEFIELACKYLKYKSQNGQSENK